MHISTRFERGSAVMIVVNFSIPGHEDTKKFQNSKWLKYLGLDECCKF